MPSEYPNFKELAPEDIPLLAEQLDRYSPAVCELALTNLLIWRKFDRPQTTLINGSLCVKIEPVNEAPYFLEPLGDGDIIRTIDLCLRDAGRLSRVSERMVSRLPPERYKVQCLRDHYDYLYDRRVLAELKGRKYDGKRNHLKNFQRRHPDYRFVPLEPGLADDCLKLFEEWFAVRQGSRYFPRLAHAAQRAAVQESFRRFPELGLTGGALLIDGRVKGFIIGSRLNRETAALHFQYAHPALQGVFQTLLWEAANQIFEGYKYLNLEQDLGIPGLRKAKSSYYPLRLEKKFELSPLSGRG